MARITGIGGIFFKAKDPKALAAWYGDVLGLAIGDWGGAMISTADPARPPHAVFSPFAADTSYYAPSTREFMLNFSVDDLDGMLAHIEAQGVAVLGRQDESYGRFAWVLDPEGTKIELWQPAAEG